MSKYMNPMNIDPFGTGNKGVITQKVLTSEFVIPDYGQPDAFGKYQIMEELGRGGMGVVYKAYDRELKRFVALKTMRMDQDDKHLKRFFKEAKAMARLSHPNIVKVHEISNDQGRAFFTMELISGCDLAEYLQNSKPTIRKIIGLMEKIILAVEYAHKNGIIHRDLKTSNILLDENDEPYVMDFGLARENQSTRISQSGAAMGTPSYMPPEQAKGEIRKVNETSDVYSLGAILYELLTGEPPFRGQSTHAILLDVVEKEPVSPRLMSPRVPQDLDLICLKALSKKQEDRYSTAQQFAQDLQNYVAGKPLLASKTNIWKHTLKTIQKHYIAAIVALLMIFAFGWSYYGQIQLDQERWQLERINCFVAEYQKIQSQLAQYRTILDLSASETKKSIAQIEHAKRHFQEREFFMADAAYHKAFHSVTDAKESLRSFYQDNTLLKELNYLRGRLGDVELEDKNLDQLETQFQRYQSMYQGISNAMQKLISDYKVFYDYGIQNNLLPTKQCEFPTSYILSSNYYITNKKNGKNQGIINIYAHKTSRRPLGTIRYSGYIHTVASSSIHKACAFSFKDGTLALWQEKKGVEKKSGLFTSSKGRNDMRTLSFHPSKPWILLANEEYASIWNYQNWRQVKLFKGFGSRMGRCNMFSPSGRYLSITTDRKILIFDTINFKKVASPNNPNTKALCFSDQDDYIAYSSNKNIHIYYWRDKEHRQIIRSGATIIHDLLLGSYLVCVSKNGQAEIRNRETFELVHKIDLPIKYGADKPYTNVELKDDLLRIWQEQSYTEYTLNPHMKKVLSSSEMKKHGQVTASVRKRFNFEKGDQSQQHFRIFYLKGQNRLFSYLIPVFPRVYFYNFSEQNFQVVENRLLSLQNDSKNMLFNPDHSWILIEGRKHTEIFQTKNFETIFRCKTDKFFYPIKFISQNKLLIARDQDFLEVWKIENGHKTVVSSWKVNESVLYALSKGGTYLSKSQNKIFVTHKLIDIYAIRGNKAIFQQRKDLGMPTGVSTVWHYDDDIVAMGGVNGQFVLWDTKNDVVLTKYHFYESIQKISYDARRNVFWIKTPQKFHILRYRFGESKTEDSLGDLNIEYDFGAIEIMPGYSCWDIDIREDFSEVAILGNEFDIHLMKLPME